MTMNQGNKVVYRVRTQGRGRPAVGEIVSLLEVIGCEPIVEIKNPRRDDTVFVHPDMIVGDYVFKPNNMKKRMSDSEARRKAKIQNLKAKVRELEAA